MDPRDRADAMLARARARGRNIVTPDNMTSPMDASDTQQIPRTLVNAVDPRRVDPDSTMIIPPGQMGQQQQRPHPQMPQQQRPQQAPQQAPQPMPAQPMPVASDDAEITQVVQQGVIPTATNHKQTRNSLSQRLNGNM